MAWEAVQFIDQDEIESANRLIPIMMINVTRRHLIISYSLLIEGFLHKFHVLVGESTCVKPPRSTFVAKLHTESLMNECSLKECGEQFLYAATLLEQLGFKGCFKQYNIVKVPAGNRGTRAVTTNYKPAEGILDATTEPMESHSRKHCGEPKVVDASTPELLNRAWDAVQFIDHNEIESTYRLIPIKVLNATEHNVHGITYKFDILVGESTCIIENKREFDVPNLNTARLRNDCQIKHGAAKFIFTASLFMEPWIQGCYEKYDIKMVRSLNGKKNLFERMFRLFFSK